MTKSKECEEFMKKGFSEGLYSKKGPKSFLNSFFNSSQSRSKFMSKINPTFCPVLVFREVFLVVL